MPPRITTWTCKALEACLPLPAACSCASRAEADHSKCQRCTLGVKEVGFKAPLDVGLPGAGSGDPWNGGICLRGHGGQPAERRKACLPALTRENTVTRTVGPKTCIPIYENMGTVSQETLLQIRRTHAVVVFQAHRIPYWW